MLHTIPNGIIKNCLKANLQEKKNGEIVLRLDKKRLHELQEAMASEGVFMNEEQILVDGVRHFVVYSSDLPDFSVIGRFCLPDLSNLELHVNRLQHLQGLHALCCSSLKFIRLEMNQLATLSGIEKCVTPSLKLLSLKRNKITDISAMRECHFPQLRELVLEGNEISSICALSAISFSQLIILQLGFNSIFSVEALASVQFPRLQTLALDKNLLTHIKSLTKIDCPDLKSLDLSWNYISDLTHFQRLSRKNGQLKDVKLDFNPLGCCIVMTKFIRPKDYKHRNNISFTHYCTNYIESSAIRDLFADLN